MSAVRLRSKLAVLLADRRELVEEMDIAAKAAGGIPRPAAERFRRRLEHVDMWIEHFQAELRKAID